MERSVQDVVKRVTDRVRERSRATREPYLTRMEKARADGPNRAHLTCGNQAHAYAASPDEDKDLLAGGRVPNLGIVTAYNDMLSAHQPYEAYPALIRQAAREMGATAQVAGGVPAMCDGVTQGQTGMDLSLFSRDLIAMASGVALSHNVFDSTVYLGVCDKIVPGLVIAAATFGHLPAVFLPAGPMTSGQTNDEKARVRQDFAKGLIGRDELLKSEMASYHGPGTCTFYGTANTNQMLMEFMGLHLPAASFENPGSGMREALTLAGARRAVEISALGDDYRPVCHILDERAFVNGIVGLNATGGSTNLLIHLLAMARAAGVVLDWEDFEEISAVTPLLARVYPNGLADVNQFHAAGGLGFLIGELLHAGLLHPDTETVAGQGLELYTREPRLQGDKTLHWVAGVGTSLNENIVRGYDQPFQETGGLKRLDGSLGAAVMKISAVAEDRHVIEAPVKVFRTQEAVRAAFQAKELDQDVVVVVRYQGPKANGMPELHNLTPILAVLQDRGHRVALVTDGRMSGASGKVPAAIHVSPEALDGGPIARLQDGDKVRVDARNGRLDILDEAVLDRPVEAPDLSEHHTGTGRELFTLFRQNVGTAEFGATILFGD
ncbi:phosphogluconate dehydratase [Coralliovum pocilloporae]|uniref:phosphogluconate dehydratase n=1 Tax=Coralliovum pocilloporae TaxID=3066369 RepID=UPI0033077090